MTSIETMLALGVLLPLASFVVLSLFGSRLGKPRAGWVACAAIAGSCLLAIIVLVQWLGMDDAARAAARSYDIAWASLGTVVIRAGVNVDSLTVIMFFMVSFISTWIFIFSLGYMAGHSDEIDGQSKFHRFFAYLSLFAFSMLGLVIADNLAFLFIFWELVGICSYLLIGYYFDKRSASNAAIKAFVVNRVGDMGFILGVAMVFLYLGDLSLQGAADEFRVQHARPDAPLFAQHFCGVSLATWMGILLFCGAIGKSAQFPLHVWLPDAMEGPTPVSALIHAATMVAAGVYLVARIFVLLTPEAQMFIAVIGCITLTIAALIAIVQTDIKKVLAYSTISQLGYMILGMGVGAWIAALFHLLTHAFFKALMFLGSGQVIEGCHHEQDMRRMGGLRHKMPVTCWTFLVGVCAIAGVGVPLSGVGVGGFYSKDEILAVAYHRSYGREHHADDTDTASIAGPFASTEARPSPPEAHAEGHGSDTPAAPRLPGWLFWVPVIIAYVTPFYMMRCWWMTFMGKPRDPHVHEHAHERPLMYVPLIVLAVGTLVASWWGPVRGLVADAHPHDFLVASFDGHAHDAAHAHGELIDDSAHKVLGGVVGFAFVIGFAAAWWIYRYGLDMARGLAGRFRTLHLVLERKFFFDELYGAVFVGGTMLIKGVSYVFDQWVIDALVNISARMTERCADFSGRVLDEKGVDGAVNALGDGTWRLGGLVRLPQVGRIRNYVLFAAAGATAVILLVVQPWE